MRILITGGAGFIGSHLCDLLIADGHALIVVDNFSTSSRANVQHLAQSELFTLVEQNVVAQPIDVAGSLDAVIHLASLPSPVDYLNNPVQTLLTGSAGTYHALELALAKGARFLLASTSEVYGDPLVHPQREDYWGNVNPIGPRGVYDESKRFAEAMSMAYYTKYGLNTHIARIFNTFGPRMRLDDGRVVPNFCRQALRNEALTVFDDGSRTRSFCYVSDLVRGLYALLLSEVHEPVNLGNPQEMSILEFAQLVIALARSQSKIAFSVADGNRTTDDPKTRQPDITRAKELLNWEPQVSVSEGIIASLAWFAERV